MFLALTVAGVVWLVFEVAANRVVAIVAGLAALAFLTVLWECSPSCGGGADLPWMLRFGVPG